jgi:hypothetical protein
MRFSMPPKISTKPEIGVVGTINRDTIYQPGGGKVESWGGLLYNLKYLCESRASRVIPVVNVGRDSFRPIMDILNRFPDLDSTYIEKVPDKNNHCFLHYHNQSHKCEILKGGVPRLTFGRIKPLLPCSLVLVNFISGPDVELAALERFRALYSGLIYIDIHSLTLGRKKVPGGFRRHLRRPRYWKRYAACADILQINEAEFELLSGWTYSKETALSFADIFLPGLQCLVITRGAEGCALIYRRAGRLRYRSIPPVKINRVYDTTGCGDIFGSGFVIEYLKSGSFIKAAQNGNRLAAARCRLKGKIF